MNIQNAYPGNDVSIVETNTECGCSSISSQVATTDIEMVAVNGNSEPVISAPRKNSAMVVDVFVSHG